jgi:hypothetical protein
VPAEVQSQGNGHGTGWGAHKYDTLDAVDGAAHQIFEPSVITRETGKAGEEVECACGL